MKHAVSTSPGKPNVLRLLSLALGTTALTGLLALAPASAETLTDALAAAYQTNPVLQAQRAVARDRRTGAPGAVRLAALGSGAGLLWLYRDRDGAQQRYQVARRPASPERLRDAQPESLRGRAHRERDRPGGSLGARRRETLASVEQNTLLNAVRAYMNVIRDQSTVELNQNNLEVLKRQLEATTDRFRVGELTRTDTAQAEARLSLARTNLTAAEAQLTASRSFYERIVGSMPGTLERPPSVTGLPESEEAARAIAAENNPTLQAARHAEEASREAVSVAKGALLPSFDVQAQVSAWPRPVFSTIRDVEESLDPRRASPPRSIRAASEHSQVRERQGGQQPQPPRGQRPRFARSTRRSAVAWEVLRASRSAIVSTREQVNASEIALEGVRQELGSRCARTTSLTC